MSEASDPAARPAARPPHTLAQLDERPRIVVRPDGDLLGLYVGANAAGDAWQLVGRRSTDQGVTWGAAEALLALPADQGHWGGGQALATADGELHVFLMHDAGTGVFALPGQTRQPLPMPERRLDVWHARTDDGGRRWRDPVKIWEGYTGSINSAIQTRAGRLVLPFASHVNRTWRDRGEGLDAFWFAGTSETIVLVSDDGETWRDTGAVLKCQTPNIGTYGAVEPVVIERDEAHGGDLWLLARTQLGRFYESFSDDGAEWTPLRPSPLISSDSPAGLVRLSDGRLVLLWNKSLRYPYAYGGRHVLHGAVSADGGASWQGHREVARDPQRYQPPPAGGDHGTAYPFPVALPDDAVLVTTGQGEGRVVVVSVDPAWLTETEQASTLAAGADSDLPDDWSAFGCRGVGLRTDVEGASGPVLEVARTWAAWPAAAVWNHPAARRGRLRLRLRLAPGAAGARLLLTDHFSVPFDPEDALHALFALRLSPAAPSGADEPPVAGEITVGVEAGGWHEVELRWDCDARSGCAVLDGRERTLPLRRLGDGVCYLRLKPAGDTVDPGFAVEAVRMDVPPPPRRRRPRGAGRPRQPRT